MSRRLDFEKASRNHQAKYGLSVKDEGEWMKNDAAANWLRRNANHAWKKLTIIHHVNELPVPGQKYLHEKG